MNWRVHGSYDWRLKYMMCGCAQINEGSGFFCAQFNVVVVRILLKLSWFSLEIKENLFCFVW